MYKIVRDSLYFKKKFVKSFSELIGVKNIGIVGSGQMGSGIAYVFGRYLFNIIIKFIIFLI